MLTNTQCRNPPSPNWGDKLTTQHLPHVHTSVTHTHAGHSEAAPALVTETASAPVLVGTWGHPSEGPTVDHRPTPFSPDKVKGKPTLAAGEERPGLGLNIDLPSHPLPLRGVKVLASSSGGWGQGSVHEAVSIPKWVVALWGDSSPSPQHPQTKVTGQPGEGHLSPRCSVRSLT